MKRMLSDVVLTERDDYWFKNYLSVPEEHELEVKKLQARDNRSFMFQNQPELQRELFDKQYELQKQRDEASLLDKAKASKQVQLSKKIIDHSDYEKEDGYKNSQEFVSQVKMELGLNDTEEDALYYAKNPQHTADLIASFKESRETHKLINSVLTEKEQFFAENMNLVPPIAFILVIFIYITYKLFQSIKTTISSRLKEYHEIITTKPELPVAITEDEVMRATLKKAVDEDTEDSKELQELINKAVARGDTETAQSLLKILERRKK